MILSVGSMKLDDSTDLCKALLGSPHYLEINQVSPTSVIGTCSCHGFERKVKNKNRYAQDMLAILFREYAAHLVMSGRVKIDQAPGKPPIRGIKIMSKFREGGYRIIESDGTHEFVTLVDKWLEMGHVTVGGHTFVNGTFRQAIVYRWIEKE